MIQTQFIDINRYWRTGGINIDKLKQQKIVGICAGVGVQMDGLLIEHTELCLENNVPYFTYHIPTPDVFGNSIEKQVDLYLNWPNVKNARTSIDIEKPFSNDPRMINSSEGLRYITRVRNILGEDVLGYSNVPNLQAIGMPSWVSSLYWWIAQYYYESGTNLFRRFDTFLAKYANKKPARVIGTPIENRTIVWQFTSKLDAQYYLANTKTKDPTYTNGILDADGNVGLIEESILLDYFHVNTLPNPELTDKEKLDILWNEYLERNK